MMNIDAFRDELDLEIQSATGGSSLALNLGSLKARILAGTIVAMEAKDADFARVWDTKFRAGHDLHPELNDLCEEALKSLQINQADRENVAVAYAAYQAMLVLDMRLSQMVHNAE